MFLSFEDRCSDSPFVERIWRCRSSRAGLFSSVAANHWEIVVTRLDGEATLTIRGPETRATRARAPGDGEWLGIEVFIGRLLRAGRIGREPVVDNVVQGHRLALSTRTAQSRFVRATGLTYGAFRQTERARHATELLRSGVPIADVVHDAGYFDQAHLTRSLKRLIGLTPGQIVRGEQQLSFLYKTTPA